MDGLILFSHGSLLCGAGETLKSHAERLLSRGRYASVEVGFMNYSEPTFEAAVSNSIKAGCDRIYVTPYFLVPGKFVGVDLPHRVDAAAKLNPGVSFVIAKPLGFDLLLADAVLALASRARSSSYWREDYNHAGEFCEADLRCPLFGTASCPRVPSKN